MVATASGDRIAGTTNEAKATPGRMARACSHRGPSGTLHAMTTTQENFPSRLRDVRWGLLLSLLTILFGFGLGGLFGAIEKTLVGRLEASAQAVKDSVYGGDEAKMKAVVSKSWNYLKRAHLHGGAIGAVGLAATLLITALRRPGRRTRAALSLVLGVGGLGYAVFWLVAGFRAPGLGGTDAAKETLTWLAFPSAGALLVGLVAVIAFTVLDLFPAPHAQRKPAPAGAAAEPPV